MEIDQQNLVHGRGMLFRAWVLVGTGFLLGLVLYVVKRLLDQ